MKRATRYAKVAALGAVLALASCGSGCGTTPNLQDARDAVVNTGNELLRQRAVITAICIEPPLIDRASCDELQDAQGKLAGYYKRLTQVFQ